MRNIAKNFALLMTAMFTVSCSVTESKQFDVNDYFKSVVGGKTFVSESGLSTMTFSDDATSFTCNYKTESTYEMILFIDTEKGIGYYQGHASNHGNEAIYTVTILTDTSINMLNYGHNYDYYLEDAE